ncbi:MAG: flavin-dependent dehydrogenase, partial [Cyanobacteria bacterium J06623_7]
PDTAGVVNWLQDIWQPISGEKIATPDGVRVSLGADGNEISIFVWQLQRTTYLKAFQWGKDARAKQIEKQLTKDIKATYPPHYPIPPAIDLAEQSIFQALEADYPQTVRFFQKMPNGEYDLNRVYWWEKRWRDSVNRPQEPREVIFKSQDNAQAEPEFDLIYVGGALGVIHAAVMALKGYRVLLIERLPFGRMNREWNISRDEFQSLINLGLFTPEEFEGVIAAEYVDGFSKFFDAYNPSHLKAAVLHTPKVLNVAIDAEKLLRFCGDKLLESGGEIWDETEFIRADIADDSVTVKLTHLPTKTSKLASARLLIDAMGTASPIAWQLNGGRTFDSVCPTVGAVIESGFAPEVWDEDYGDVLNSHGDISRGRQLIWELFPAGNGELTFYLFHYHQVHPDNPGSLLEMYEDFFTILPEYRRCDMEQLVWKKPTFGYIPGHFSTSDRDRTVAFDRLVAIGDAASLQSPLIFTGFGSLVRNLDRLTTLLDTALQHDLLSAKHLNQVRAYQSNISVTWLFSKGMMVPTGTTLPPQRINSMLNTFFGLLAEEPPEVADTFIKDRTDWLTFTRLALIAARKNPALLVWIWKMAGSKDMLRWLGSYWSFNVDALRNLLLASWFPQLVRQSQPWLEKQNPALWLKLLSLNYQLRHASTSIADLKPKLDS